MTKTTDHKNVMRRRLVKKQRAKCPLCGQSLVWWKATLDHIIPKSKGGPDAEWNLQAVHHKCNGVRGNTDLPPEMRKEAELHLGIRNGIVRTF